MREVRKRLLAVDGIAGYPTAFEHQGENGSDACVFSS
jgi:hypothetical protein